LVLGVPFNEQEIWMRKTIVTILAITGSIATVAFAADREVKVEDRLDASADTLMDMMKASDHGIPQDLLDKAKCVVVVPGMKKAGFIFGAEAVRAGARRPRCGLKAAVSDFRLALRRPTLRCW
jgi:hypothetical protein